MNIKFEVNDQLEVIADATGISTNKGGQYIIAKWVKLGTQNSSRSK